MQREGQSSCSPLRRVSGVFIDGHNTTSAQNLGFQPLVSQDLMRRGYQVTNDPSRAGYMVKYNVRYIGKQTARNTAPGVLAGGFGAGITSAAFGGTTAAYGLAGALVGGVVGHFLSQKAYMMVVDIQLEQRQAGVYTTSQTNAQQGARQHDHLEYEQREELEGLSRSHRGASARTGPRVLVRDAGADARGCRRDERTVLRVTLPGGRGSPSAFQRAGSRRPHRQVWALTVSSCAGLNFKAAVPVFRTA